MQFGGGVLPCAILPPPSTVPSTAEIPWFRLELATFALRTFPVESPGWSANTPMPTSRFRFATRASTVLPGHGEQDDATAVIGTALVRIGHVGDDDVVVRAVRDRDSAVNVVACIVRGNAVGAGAVLAASGSCLTPSRRSAAPGCVLCSSLP